MKAIILKYIFAYFSAAYFLVAGAGFNVVNYCCQYCENEGIEMVSTDSCFAVHHQVRIKNSQELHADLFCADIAKHVDTCRFIRLNTDIPSSQVMNKLLLEQISMVLLFNVFGNFFVDKAELPNRINTYPSKNFLSLSGRSILTFHAILLI